MVSNCPTDNDYAVVMDPRFKSFASKLRVGVLGAEVVWAAAGEAQGH